MRITNKRQMTEMLQRGDFGNTTRTWSFNDFFLLRDEEYDGTFALRSLTPGNKLYPWNTGIEALELMICLNIAGVGKDYYVQEVMDCSHYLLAGEVGTVNGTLVLEYTRSKKMMRDAFLDERIHVSEAKARCLLKAIADSDDYEDLMLLVDTYPEHIIEFTLLDCYAGKLGRRMMVWEVRNY